MEDDLDRIAEGQIDWQQYLGRFYLGNEGLANQVVEALENVDARAASTVDLGDVEVRVGRYGPFLEQSRNGDRVIAAVPDDLAPGDLHADLARDLLDKAAAGPDTLGEDPETAEAVYLKDGPFGPYVQLGEDGTGKDKPKRVSIPKDMDPESVSLKTALALLALPRELGSHPEDGEPVKAGIGRYGPYVLHEGVFASLKAEDDVLDVDLDRALQLLEEKKSRKGRGGRRSKNVLLDLGVHPDDSQPVQVLDGRYGPYVKHGKTNATVPKDTDPMKLTLEDALRLIEEKRSRGGPIKRSRIEKS
jgi:DNA topoisomerase-1